MTGSQKSTEPAEMENEYIVYEDQNVLTLKPDMMGTGILLIGCCILFLCLYGYYGPQLAGITFTKYQIDFKWLLHSTFAWIFVGVCLALSIRPIFVCSTFRFSKSAREWYVNDRSNGKLCEIQSVVVLLPPNRTQTFFRQGYRPSGSLWLQLKNNQRVKIGPVSGRNDAVALGSRLAKFIAVNLDQNEF